MNRVLVVGGYGTFGSLVCRELSRRRVHLTIAGRDRNKAESLARELGEQHDGMAVDLSLPATFRSLLRSCAVAVNCAGPFHHFDPSFLDACADARCHYVDITDDRSYATLVRQCGPRFVAAGVAAVYGCSSLPAISGALALKLLRTSVNKPIRVRVTLFIGNDNPKGEAAVASLFGGLGRAIAAPQGVLRGGHGREVVPLPAPFGRRVVLNFDSPDYDLLPALLDVAHVSVKVGFELRLCTEAMAALTLSGWRFGPRAASCLARAGNWLKGIGCSGGAVMTEFFDSDGSTRRAAVVAPTDGQRMAALPCAIVTHALVSATRGRLGACTAYELLGGETLLREMQAAMPGLNVVMG